MKQTEMKSIECHEQFVLRRKSDGWFVSPGSKHHSSPEYAIKLNASELVEWRAAWGLEYEAVKASEAKEVE